MDSVMVPKLRRARGKVTTERELVRVYRGIASEESTVCV
jgi:hypothetical protein